MREIAETFAGLLRPMVASLDRFGLKARHLRKHRPSVEEFSSDLERRDYQTEVAVIYRTRFARDRDKLVTFLDCDGLPWNNNNAEHAIKAFVRLRRGMDDASTVKGMEEYLVLLSTSETCRAKALTRSTSFGRVLSAVEPASGSRIPRRKLPGDDVGDGPSCDKIARKTLVAPPQLAIKISRPAGTKRNV